MSAADRRSELFLSCDLVGSTALKQRRDAEWEELFLSFYIDFPQRLGEIAHRRNVPFMLWKPIGDELVFRVRVTSEEEVFNAVRAWLETLAVYEADSKTASRPSGLKTKGGAFVGTFPGPDVEASVLRDPTEIVSDVLGLAEINDAALAARDHDRHIFDFFGPSFDTGFRVIGQSTSRHFTLSVEVAWAMVRAADQLGKRMDDLVFIGPTELKGVWDGRDYPVFAVDREHDDPINKAMRDLVDGHLDDAKVKNLLSACVEESALPTRLYLPGSSLAVLKDELPPDALERLRGSKSDVGIEKQPTATEEKQGKKVVAAHDMPLGDAAPKPAAPVETAAKSPQPKKP